MSDWLVVGKFTAAYGIKGWVKLHSYTDPIDNIIGYQPLFFKKQGKWQALEIEKIQRHAKSLIAKVKGCDNRDQTPFYSGCELGILESQLPKLKGDDFYWSDLMGLTVKSDQGQIFGVVDHLLETGSNDVLVVKATEHSIDDQERLIPYLFGDVVKNVDLQAREIIVDWDADF